MKRRVLAVLVIGAMTLAACGASNEGADAATTEAEPSGAAASPSVADDQAEPVPAGPGKTIAPNAPEFAVLYPGATLEAPPTLAGDAQGIGGLATFVTDADPEAVIAFYRDRAEATGLASVMAMNQGEAQAYGAAGPAGETLQVVASPTDEASTSVQLTWSAGG